MSNNEWNREVGKRWRELTQQEQEPFKIQAQQDKKRFEDVSVYIAKTNLIEGKYFIIIHHFT